MVSNGACSAISSPFRDQCTSSTAPGSGRGGARAPLQMMWSKYWLLGLPCRSFVKHTDGQDHNDNVAAACQLIFKPSVVYLTHLAHQIADNFLKDEGWTSNPCSILTWYCRSCVLSSHAGLPADVTTPSWSPCPARATTGVPKLSRPRARPPKE